MDPRKAIGILFISALVVLASMAAVNYTVDTMCFYHCDSIDLQKRTGSSFYERVQLIGGHMDAQVIILGSSRGESTPPWWVQRQTGLKTINLSVGGADLLVKVSLLNLALEKLHLKKVIWYGDYFEFAKETTDAKLKNSAFMKKYIPEPYRPGGLGVQLAVLQSLVDRGIFEASVRSFKEPFFDPKNFGSGTTLPETCGTSEYHGEKTLQQMEKEAGVNYEFFTRTILKYPQAESYWDLFLNQLQLLSSRGIDVILIIPPYHPVFAKRLAKDFPEIYNNSVSWAKRVAAVKLPHITVKNYFDGLPDGDDGSPLFWNDGVHFNCKSATDVLRPLLAPKRS